METTWNPALPASPTPFPALAEGSVPEIRMAMALALCEGIGPVSFHRLLDVFGSPEAVFAAPEWEIKQACPHLGAGALIALRRGPGFQEVDRQEAECLKHGVRLLTWRMSGYPTPLLDLEAPPPLLYIQGEWRPEDLRALAVVGTRSPSPYGVKSAQGFGYRLAQEGWTVVSGLARGVDTLAHEAALAAGSRTVAVLGSGLDRLYPRENLSLARRIAESGCVISEFPMGMEPLAENFPRRNRIISGLSRGTLVVEAGNDSGSLITAQYALEQGREVFAVPGAIMTPGTRGTHKLIKEGAHLADHPEDVFKVLEGLPEAAPARRLPPRGRPAGLQGSLFGTSAEGRPRSGRGSPGAASATTAATATAAASKAAVPSDLKDSHRMLLELLGNEAVTLDGVAERMRARPGRAALPTHRLLSELLQLELMGVVKRLPGAVFRRA